MKNDENTNKEERKIEEFADLFDPTYRGNIFGWKFSLTGLAVMVFLLGFVIYRHQTMGVSFSGQDVPQEVRDSLYRMVEDTIIKHPLE